mgnify:CR=1 FL=1
MQRPSWVNISKNKVEIMEDFLKKLRPQIVLAIFTLGLVSTVALLSDGEQYIAVVTGCTGGIIALGMKLLDGE